MRVAVALGFLALTELAAQQAPRTPQGIYALVNIQENTTVQQNANPSITPAQLEGFFVNLYQNLLGNPAVSGLVLYANWGLLNPNPPSAASPYDWSLVDDAFNQASAAVGKTIQLVVSPGFQSPQWILNQIPSCDGLFQTPVQTPSSACGKATFTGFVEGGGTRELPMPWDPVYKSSWQTFLMALDAQYLSNPALVSIAVAGPTASSEEMILPDNANTPAQDQFGGMLPNAMWLKLLAFHYPGMAAYDRSDQGFIDEWEAAIDMYGQIFSGVTLVATTGAGLPNLAAMGFTVPSAFGGVCPNPDMDCAAETTILAYFGDPSVGGANAKAVQEDGLEAVRVGVSNLGVAGIKFVSQMTAQLPASAAQILGGAQFNSSFTNFTLQEGCYSKFPPNASDTPAGCSIPKTCTVQGCIPVACIPQACLAPGGIPSDLAGYATLSKVPGMDLLTPEQAEYNVLNKYFDGTPAASSFAATPGAAPLNYLQIYSPDILYAKAHAGAPAQIVQADGSSASMSAQDLLNLASQEIQVIAEPATTPCN